jgi:hypothetical protein
MQDPYGNLPVTAWILVNGFMLTHGIKFWWSRSATLVIAQKLKVIPPLFFFFFGVLYLFREGDKTAILKQLQKIEDVSNKNVPQCMGCCYPTFPSIATSKWKGMYFHDIRLIVDNFFSLVPADDLARSYLVLAALAQRFSFLSPCFSHSLLVFLTLVLCI